MESGVSPRTCTTIGVRVTAAAVALGAQSFVMGRDDPPRVVITGRESRRESVQWQLETSVDCRKRNSQSDDLSIYMDVRTTNDYVLERNYLADTGNAVACNKCICSLVAQAYRYFSFYADRLSRAWHSTRVDSK
jgi:hypothetical protein